MQTAYVSPVDPLLLFPLEIEIAVTQHVVLVVNYFDFSLLNIAQILVLCHIVLFYLIDIRRQIYYQFNYKIIIKKREIKREKNSE